MASGLSIVFISHHVAACSLVWRIGSFGKKPASEPPSDRLVIEIEAGIRDRDTRDKQQNAYDRSMPCRNLVPDYPGGVDVDQRIVRDVQRIRDVPQQRGKPGLESSADAFAGTGRDDDGE
jgi:hypothetical protein